MRCKLFDVRMRLDPLDRWTSGREYFGRDKIWVDNLSNPNHAEFPNDPDNPRNPNNRVTVTVYWDVHQ